MQGILVVPDAGSIVGNPPAEMKPASISVIERLNGHRRIAPFPFLLPSVEGDFKLMNGQNVDDVAGVRIRRHVDVHP